MPDTATRSLPSIREARPRLVQETNMFEARIGAVEAARATASAPREHRSAKTQPPRVLQGGRQQLTAAQSASGGSVRPNDLIAQRRARKNGCPCPLGLPWNMNNFSCSVISFINFIARTRGGSDRSIHARLADTIVSGNKEGTKTSTPFPPDSRLSMSLSRVSLGSTSDSKSAKRASASSSGFAASSRLQICVARPSAMQCCTPW